MSTLGKAVILFGADTTLFRGDVGKAVAIFESGLNRMSQLTVGFKSQLAAGFSVAGIIAFTQHVIDAADELEKLHEKTGHSVETLSAWRLAAQLSEVDAGSFAKGLRDFNRTLVEATDLSSRSSRVLRAMGVDVTQGPTVAFRQFAEAFSKLPDNELRTAAAMEVMKKSGAEWIPLLAQGTRGLDDATDKARALGLVVSEDFAKQAEKYNNNMRLLGQASVGFANALLKDTLPVLTELSAVMAKAAERSGTLGAIMQGVRYLDARTGAALSPNDPLFKEKLDRVRTQMVEPGALHSGQIASGKIKTWDYVGDLPLASDMGPDPEAVRKALAESESLYKRQALAVQSMEEKKRSLFGLDEQELMLVRIREGSYKDFDAQTKVRLLNMALEIDLRHEMLEEGRVELERLTAINEQRERGAEIFTAFNLAGRADLEQRQFEIGLLGRSTREQEVLNAAHQVDLGLLQARRAAATAYGENVAGYDKEAMRLEEEASRQRERVIAQIRQRQEIERSWAVGAKNAFHEYADAASNSAAQAQMLWSDAFRGSEDALVDFVKNGKLNFSSLADSIISDMTRIAVRRAVLGPIADWLIGGSGLAGPLASLGGSTNNFGAGFGAGADTLGMGAVPYAAGGRTAAGGVRLVGERGPELFVPDVAGSIVSNGSLGRMGGARVQVNVNIQTPDPASFRASSRQVASDITGAVSRGLG